jgi:hypothetical protein
VIGPTPLLPPPPPKREKVRWYIVESTLGAQRGGPYLTRGAAEEARAALAKKDPSEAPTLKLESRTTLETERPPAPPAPPVYGFYPWV